MKKFWRSVRFIYLSVHKRPQAIADANSHRLIWFTWSAIPQRFRNSTLPKDLCYVCVYEIFQGDIVDYLCNDDDHVCSCNERVKSKLLSFRYVWSIWWQCHMLWIGKPKNFYCLPSGIIKKTNLFKWISVTRKRAHGKFGQSQSYVNVAKDNPQNLMRFPFRTISMTISKLFSFAMRWLVPNGRLVGRI